MADDKEKKASFRREPARRMFISEIETISLSYKKDTTSDQAPTYFVSPLGCEANRVFLVGVLTEMDDIGTEKPYYRGKVSDPTGEIAIYAGEYNPEAAASLSSMEIPEFVAIVGKLNIYTPEDGDPIMSIRAERVVAVNDHVRQMWVRETMNQTLARIASMSTGPLNDAQDKAWDYYQPGDLLVAMKDQLSKWMEDDMPVDGVPTENSPTEPTTEAATTGEEAEEFEI